MVKSVSFGARLPLSLAHCVTIFKVVMSTAPLTESLGELSEEPEAVYLDPGTQDVLGAG